MTPLHLYDILGCRWQEVPHISIFRLYHLRRPVLLSPRIIPAYFLESYTWNMDGSLTGHHQRRRFQTSGQASYPWHSRRMANTSSRVQAMGQFVCGMPRRERRRQALSQDTPVRSFLWHSRRIASTSSRVQKIGQFVCGMPRRERCLQALS